jgi:hypothetical protein
MNQPSSDKSKKRTPQPSGNFHLPAPGTGFSWEKANAALIDDIQGQIGEATQVLREMLTTGPRVDIHVVPPTDALPFYKLFTIGMSQIEMPAPRDHEECTRAELLICLPSQWPMSAEQLLLDENYWPIRLLRDLARLPQVDPKHRWLFAGHAVPNGEPAHAYAVGVPFVASLLLRPLTLDEESHVYFNQDQEPVHLLSVIPLYAEEFDAVQNQDPLALLEALDEIQVTEILDLSRPNTCERQAQ